MTSPAGGGSVVRLDPESHDVLDTIEVGTGPVGIVVGAGAVWVANSQDGTVSRIDPETNTVVDTIPVGNTPTGVAFGAGAVWVTNAADRSVSRIDPATDKPGRPIDVDAAAQWIAVGDGAVWVTDPIGGTLVRLDIRTEKVTHRIPVGSGPGAVAFGNGAVWVTNGLDGTLSRVDPRLASVSYAIPVGSAPNGVAVAPDGVWVTNEASGTLVHVDRVSRDTTSTTLGGRPEGVTLSGGSLWIAVQAAGAAHRGGTLRLALTDIDSIEPASFQASQVTPNVYDGLVGFKRVGGTDGYTLVPDLATGLPRPTDNNRTYTFRLRKGIKLSDGSELEASAVRSLERLFRANGEAASVFDAIGARLHEATLSAATCRGRPDRRRQRHRHDQAQPAGRRAPLEARCMCPSSRPAPKKRRGEGQAVPGTGPYRIAEYIPAKRLRLVRIYFQMVESLSQTASRTRSSSTGRVPATQV